MTFPEFLSWQAYARHKAREAAAAPGARERAPVNWDDMPTLGGLTPGELANVIKGR
jgi:hypothetical protein